MAAFQTQIDIGSRALQHIGSSRMDPVLGFNDTAVRGAPEAGFAYDKVREAVLQENVWTCAVRRTVLRPVDANTMLLAPALWTSGTTYFIGSIVTDQSGNMWISNIPNNLANDPLLSNFWDPYFGPMTASLYDTATAYFSGELVYTTSGDGKNRCYLSLQNGNSDNPGIATAWSATTTYFKNQVVTYLSIAYMSLIDLNTNNTPSASPALFNIATTYAIGNTVGASDGVIYTSLSNGNVGNDPTLDGGVHWSSGGVLNKWTTVFVGCWSIRSAPGHLRSRPAVMPTGCRQTISAQHRRIRREQRHGSVVPLAIPLTIGITRTDSSLPRRAPRSHSGSWPILPTCGGWRRCSVKGWRHGSVGICATSSPRTRGNGRFWISSTRI